MIGAVDIGGTKVAIAMVSESGTILTQTEMPTMAENGPEYGIKRIVAMLRDCEQQVAGKMLGVGIGCTGPVDPITGELGRIAFLPTWEGFNLLDRVQNALNLPAAIENDADAAALGEYAWGAGKGMKRFIYVTVSTGIGGGIILDGHLYRGVGGAHPEIGHQIIDPSGPECYCGANGCWEIMAGGRALAHWAGRSTAQEVCEAAMSNEPDTCLAIEREGYYLGLGLANLITLYVPDMIALGGGVMNSLHLFREIIEKIVQKSCGLVPYKNTRIVSAVNGKNAGLIGAGQVWLQHYQIYN